MPQLWYLCFMYGDLLWPDLELEPSLVWNIYSISTLPYILGVFGISFGPKLIILRSLRLVTWKSRLWPLTRPSPDTWTHFENVGGVLGSSHWELSNAVPLVSLRPFVRELWHGDVGALVAFNAPPPASRGWRNTTETAGLTRALMGLWIFHHLLGGGCLNILRLSRLLRIVEQNGKRHSKAREKSFRNHFGHFLAHVKNKVTRGQNPKKKSKWFLDDKIFNFKGRATILIPSCLSRQGARRTMYNVTLKSQGQNLTWCQVRAMSLGDPSRSTYTSFDAPCGDKRNDSNPTSLSHLLLKLLAKNCWWARVTSMTFRGVTN